jgi:hypothetical protein
MRYISIILASVLLFCSCSSTEKSMSESKVFAATDQTQQSASITNFFRKDSAKVEVKHTDTSIIYNIVKVMQGQNKDTTKTTFQQILIRDTIQTQVQPKEDKYVFRWWHVPIWIIVAIVGLLLNDAIYHQFGKWRK